MRSCRHAPFRVAVCAGIVVGLVACGSRVEDRFTTPTTPPPGSTGAPATSEPATSAVVTSAVVTTGVGPATTSPVTSPAPTTAGPTTTQFDEAAARAEVVELWRVFFATDTTLDERVAMLENGEALRDAVALAMANPLLSQAVVTVTSVTFDSAERATVVYDVSLSGSGNVVLPGAQGVAVRIDGTWKFGEATMCGLASLAVEGDVPGCD